MQSELLSFIEAGYRTKRQFRLLLWLVFLGGAAALLVASFVSFLSNDVYDTNEYAGLAIFPGVIGLIAFASWWPIRSANAVAIHRIIRERPHDVAWVHIKHVHVTNRGMHHYWIVFGDLERKLHSIQIGQHEVDRVLALTQAALPHATFGHGQGTQQQFYANPASLRRGPAPAPAQQAPTQQGAPQQAATPGGALRVTVAPQVSFGHIDHAMRSLGLVGEPPGPPVAPGEPGAAAWSASWARVVYRYEPPHWARTLEISAQNPADLRAKLAASLPLAG